MRQPFWGEQRRAIVDHTVGSTGYGLGPYAALGWRPRALRGIPLSALLASILIGCGGTLSTRERCARRAGQRPRPAVATALSGACVQLQVRLMRASRVHADRPEGRVPCGNGDEPPRREAYGAPQGHACARRSSLVPCDRSGWQATCQAADLSRRACSRSRALQESRPERPQPMETEASRAYSRIREGARGRQVSAPRP